MPRRTSSSGTKKVVINLANYSCQFSFRLEDGRAAYGFIGTGKFDKHILPIDFDPAIHGANSSTEKWAPPVSAKTYSGMHTMIAPAGLILIRPLYEFFARDFVAEFAKGNFCPLNAELEYTKQDVMSFLARGIDVSGKKDNFNFSFLRVGALVEDIAASRVTQSKLLDPVRSGTITVVFFQHGPLISTKSKP